MAKYTAQSFEKDVNALTTSAEAFKRAVEFAARNVRDHGNLDPTKRLLDAIKKAGKNAPRIASQGREYLSEQAGVYYEKDTKSFKYDKDAMTAELWTFDAWLAKKQEDQREARRNKEYNGKEVDAEAAEALAKAMRKASKAGDENRAAYYRNMVTSLGYRLDEKGKVTAPDEAVKKAEAEAEKQQAEEQEAEAEVVS